jgi:hypothetical protein
MEDNIKLPGSSFDEVSKIIQGYAQINRAASLGEISRRIGMHSTIISRNNGFLISIGILEGGRDKVITKTGKRLGDALNHELEPETREILREIVESNEFLKNLIGAVRIRKGMDEGALKAHVAYSAGQAKSQGVMTGTGTVVEILKRAGVIEEKDGKLIVSPPTLSSVTVAPLHSENPLAVTRSTRVVSGNFNTNVVININISCTPTDLIHLGSQLRSLLAEIGAQSTPSMDGDEEQ